MRWNRATVSESAQWRSSKTIADRWPSRISPTSCGGHVEPGVEGRLPLARAAQLRDPLVVGAEVVAEDVEQQLEGAAEAAGVGLAGQDEAARRAGRTRNSRTRRVLPTPASPPTSAMPGRRPGEERAELLELLVPCPP